MINVGMGEVGIIRGNGSGHLLLCTMCASPCVIYGVALRYGAEGKTSILAHVHRGNRVSDLEEKIQSIVQADRANAMQVKSYVVTLRVQSGSESGPQGALIGRLEEMTSRLFGTQPARDDGHPAAVLDHKSGDLVMYGDDNAPFGLVWGQHVGRPTYLQRMMKLDDELRIGDNRVGLRYAEGSAT